MPRITGLHHRNLWTHSVSEVTLVPVCQTTDYKESTWSDAHDREPLHFYLVARVEVPAPIGFTFSAFEVPCRFWELWTHNVSWPDGVSAS